MVQRRRDSARGVQRIEAASAAAHVHVHDAGELDLRGLFESRAHVRAQAEFAIHEQGRAKCICEWGWSEAAYI
eukprot:3910333-Pleurochrysis_carterae.AAC.1